jgi:hypothetical protein
MNAVYVLKRRIISLISIYKIKNIIASVTIGTIFCVFLFQEYQISAGLMIIIYIHFTRKDINFIKTVYDEWHKIILLFEYSLIFLYFIVFAIVLKDKTMTIWPYAYFFILIIIFLENKFKFPFQNILNFNSFISSENYEWKSGIRKYSVKIIILFIIFIFLTIKTSNIYLFNILLFLLFFYINSFYEYLEPFIFLENRGDTFKKIIWNTIKLHLKSFIVIIIIPFIFLFIKFIGNKMILYSIFGLISCMNLILFLILNKYKYFIQKNTKELNKIIISVSTIVIIFPPLSIILLLYNIILYKKLTSTNDYFKKLYS